MISQICSMITTAIGGKWNVRAQNPKSRPFSPVRKIASALHWIKFLPSYYCLKFEGRNVISCSLASYSQEFTRERKLLRENTQRQFFRKYTVMYAWMVYLSVTLKQPTGNLKYHKRDHRQTLLWERTLFSKSRSFFGGKKYLEDHPREMGLDQYIGV